MDVSLKSFFLCSQRGAKEMVKQVDEMSPPGWCTCRL